MDHPESAGTSGTGVARTMLAVREELGWLFREQPSEDYGIDAQTEVVESGRVTGRLIAMQIKSGKSWFKEPTSGGWWFRPKRKHVAYWTRHSLPVVVVLVHPKTKTCHWQLVSEATLETSKNGKPKLLVPEGNVLDKSAMKSLNEASKGEPYELRLRELRLALPWMKRLASGERMVVEMEEWVNKSSGRGTIHLCIDHEDGETPEVIATWWVMLGLHDYADAIQRLVAWADVEVHEETYDDAEYERWEVEGAFETFEDWRRPLLAQGLRPYRNGAGEVDFWRLELTLNTLGKAFVQVDAFASSGHAQLIK